MSQGGSRFVSGNLTTVTTGNREEYALLSELLLTMSDFCVWSLSLTDLRFLFGNLRKQRFCGT